jgi:signal transduction histidine kinase
VIPEALLPSFVELVPDAVALVTADGLVRAVNDAFAKAFGRPRRDLLDTRLAAHVADPEDRLQAHLEQWAGSRQPLPGALTIQQPGRRSARQRCEGWLLRPADGSAPAMVAIRLLNRTGAGTQFTALTRQVGELTAEIGHRRRAESRLVLALETQTALQERLALLADAPAALLASLSMPDVHRELGDLARRLIPADAHAVWHFNSSERIWRIAWHEGLADGFVMEIANWQGTPSGAVPFDKPLAVSDVRIVPILSERRHVYEKEGIRSLLTIPLRIRGENHGTVVAYYKRPARFDEETLRVAAALGNLGSSALTTATLYELQLQTRRTVELAEHRAHFLASAAAALASSLDYETMLQTVANLAVPEVADWCTVDIADPDGTLQRVAIAHVDPAKIELARLLRERYPQLPSSPYGVHQVMRTNQPILMRRIPESLLNASAHDPEHLDLLRALQLRSYMCVPLAVHGRATGAITFVSAESRREYTEEDLRLATDVASRAALALENARVYAEARRANQLKDDFLATLSHELRTPLNAILGYVRMLRAGAVPPDRHGRALEVVERNANALNAMVEDVLDVSRVVAGKIRLNVQPVDVAIVVQDAIATVTPAADAKGLRIQAIVDPNTPPVSGDPARLQQVVWNLLSNAVKFTPRGGRVQVRVERTDSQVEIVVSDTGIGIEPDFLPHIFERFRQADARFSREHGGLGLGLAIARHFVELHGGVIHATSAGSGQGSTFRVQLPAMIVHAEPRPTPVRVHPLTTTGSIPVPLPAISGVHVLAVDDEADSRALLAEVLEAAGARVTLAGSAIEALQALAHETPHVIISDVGMPGIDGFEFIARVRQLSGPARNLPVAALTAYARSEDRVRALECGFQMHLAKPINPSELVAAVKVLANRPS